MWDAKIFHCRTDRVMEEGGLLYDKNQWFLWSDLLDLLFFDEYFFEEFMPIYHN